MLISIIIPTYNVAPYVEECLDSIAVQTYQGAVECIIVDDCSTDNTRKAVEKWLEDYKGSVEFRAIWLKKNGRQGNARNVGTRYAKGEYVIFVDSDDVISNDCLEVMVKALHDYPFSFFFIGNMEDINGGPAYLSPNTPQYSNDRKWIMRQSLFEGGIIAPGMVNKLMRRDLLIKHGISFPVDVIFEDVQFSFLLGVHSKAVTFLPQKVTYFYRTNRNGSTITSISKDTDYAFTSRLTIVGNLIDKISEEYRSIQAKALICRYILYMRITDVQTINRHLKQMREIEDKLLSVQRRGARFISSIYFLLPITLRRNILITKLFTNIIRF